MYTLISLIALLFDGAVYFVSVNFTNIYPPILASVSYSAGLILAYFLLLRFVYSKANNFRTIFLFLLSGILGIISTFLSSFIFLKFIYDDAYWAKVCAVLVSYVVVFLYREYFVFKSLG
jgi:putative flippase GtrA